MSDEIPTGLASDSTNTSVTTTGVGQKPDLLFVASRVLKQLVAWSVWGGMSAIAFIFLLAVALELRFAPWLLDIAKAHFAATIGLPFAALASFAIVTILESTAGPLEFEGLSFKFKGASGPAVLWAVCFLIIAIAIKALW